jgi:hypothetical protein
MSERVVSTARVFDAWQKKLEGGNMTGTVCSRALLAIVITLAISRPANGAPKDDDGPISLQE